MQGMLTGLQRGDHDNWQSCSPIGKGHNSMRSKCECPALQDLRDRYENHENLFQAPQGDAMNLFMSDHVAG